MARAWFFLVLLNSSSFSATRLSISCLTCPSSSWARRTLFSSCSRVPSASSRAPCSSSFSCSRRRLCLSRSWMERPPSPSWSRRSLISSARFLFSRLTMSSCSRPSSWEAATSAETSAALDCHSPRTLSKFLPLFSVMRAAACTLSYSMARSSSSLFILTLDFSALATLVVRASTSSSFSTILDCGVHPLVLHGKVVKLVVHPGLGLLGVGHLGGESVDQLLVLNNLGLQLVAGSLELLNAAHAFGLEAGLPQLDLSLGLGESLQGIRLPHGFVLHLLPEVLQVGGHHLVLGQQRRAVFALSISQSLGVLQLGGDRDLALVHVGNGGLQLVDLAGEVLVLDLQPLLGGLSLIEGTGHLVQPGVGVHNVALDQLATLVQVSLALDGLLQVAAGIAEVELHVGLVLLGLHLVGIEVVNLLSQVSHGVVVFHAQSSKGALVGNVELLKLSLQAGKLALPLLVQLDLGGCVGTGLLQP